MFMSVYTMGKYIYIYILRRNYHVLYAANLTPYSNSVHISILIVALGKGNHGEWGNSGRTLRMLSMMDIIM